MTGRAKTSLRKKARIYRLEKLETRYALSAGGFDCGPTEQGFVIATTDVATDYATEIRELQNRHPSLNRELSRFEPERLQNRQFGGNRSDSLGNRDGGGRRAETGIRRHVGRSITVMQTLPPRNSLSTNSIGEGESFSQTRPDPRPLAPAFETVFVTVFVAPRSTLATPANTFSGSLNLPPTFRPVTNLAALSTSNDSSNELRQASTGAAIAASEASADSQAVAIRLTETQISEERAAVATGQSEVIRFISLQEIAAEPADSLTHSRTSLDLSSLDRWLSQEDSLEQPLRELDDLLQAISADRVRLRSADLEAQVQAQVRRGGVQLESQDTDARLHVDSSVSGVGMILLGSGTATDNSVAQVTAQVFDDVNQSTAAQWAVGIGMYRAMAFSEQNGFASGPVTHVASEVETNTTPLASDSSFAASSITMPPIEATLSQRGAGVVFCMLGIRYLQRRRGQGRKGSLDVDSVGVRESPLFNHRQRRHL